MTLSRRALIERGVYLGSVALVGCGTEAAFPDADAGIMEGSDAGVPAGPDAADAGGPPDAAGVDAGHADAGPGDTGVPPELCDDPFEGANRAGQLAFDGEGSVPLNEVINRGWDGRLYTDLSVLTLDDLIIANERFYIRTREPDLIDRVTPWTVAVDGLVGQNLSLGMDEIRRLSSPQGAHVLECSGNGRGGSFGLLSNATWGGASVRDLFAGIDIRPEATHVLVSGFDEHSVPSAGGHSTPGASWIFSLDQLYEAGSFFATEMNGVTLPADHGFPVRLFNPGWYGCTCIKWVNQIRFIDNDQPATSQMREFASRTHQSGRPAMARDYRPATQDQAAMPVRIEKWRLGSDVIYNVVGIMWGGDRPTDALAISFNEGRSFEPVAVCPRQTTNATWTLWSHPWRPSRRGTYAITMGVTDPSIATHRLDRDWYLREVIVDEV